MKLNNYKILLGSNSPRRKELLKELNIDFTIQTLPHIDESYPSTLHITEVAEYVAKKKASSYLDYLSHNELLITADTIVILDDTVFGKPENRDAAKQMLRTLSNNTHLVTSGVSLATTCKSVSFSVTTEVDFAPLSDKEIEYYITHFAPFDKAGSYGIQEWIGYIGVKRINGCFYNVMGLPVQKLYSELKRF